MSTDDRRASRRPLSLGARVLALCAVLTTALAGCAATPTKETAVPHPAGPTATASATADPDSLARFDSTNRSVIRRDRHAGGSDFVAALAAAGFPAKGLEVTPDRTTIGLDFPSIQFAALVGGRCLIGQYGDDSGGYRSITAAPVNGRCLIGSTRPIR